MKYMLLIYSTPTPADMAPDPNELKRWFDYSNDLVAAGVMVAGDPLQGVETARTIRNRDGSTTTTDGPFAETKEVLGGYYLIDVDSEDEAVSWAVRCPGADYGSVEVRPLASLPDAPID